MDTIPNGHNPEWTQSRMDTIPNGHNPEWTQSRMDTIPNKHNPEWTPSRMDTIPNGHHPERHNPEWTQSRMDTIPNGHNPEWTQSRMSSGVATMCGLPRKNNSEAPPERIAIQKQWRGNDFHTGGLKKFQGGIEPPCPPASRATVRKH